MRKITSALLDPIDTDASIDIELDHENISLPEAGMRLFSSPNFAFGKKKKKKRKKKNQD